MDPDTLLDLLDFTHGRHSVWRARRAFKDQADWLAEVSDERLRDALARYSFTNVFRILDTGSQYLARELLYGDVLDAPEPEDLLMRCALYRLTNLPDPWVFYVDAVGRAPITADLADGTLGETLRAYEGPILRQAYYLHTTGTHPDGSVDRRTWLTWWAGKYLDPGSPDNVTLPFLAATTTRGRIEALKGAVRIGDFLSMQVVDDMSWAPTELVGLGETTEYVVPGPGARWGAAELDPSRPAEEVMAEVHELLVAEGPRIEVHGRELPVRLMDTQNVLCEFSKLSKIYRGQGKRTYKLGDRGPALGEPFYPPHW